MPVINCIVVHPDGDEMWDADCGLSLRTHLTRLVSELELNGEVIAMTSHDDEEKAKAFHRDVAFDIHTIGMKTVDGQ